MSTIELRDETTPEPVSTLKALIMMPILLVLIGIFAAASGALGSTEFFVGFLFLLYWAGLQHADFKALPGAILGSLLGLGLALLLNVLTTPFGQANGTLGFVALFLPVMFCQLRGLLPTLVNNATMLQLLVGTITHIQAHADFKGMFINLGVAVVYFGGLLWGVSKLKARAEAKELVT